MSAGRTSAAVTSEEVGGTPRAVASPGLAPLALMPSLVVVDSPVVGASLVGPARVPARLVTLVCVAVCVASRPRSRSGRNQRPP